MQSLLYAKSSDGTANASLMTVQTLRSPGATTAIVNTVSGVPAGGFYASMGAPHTFTDPVTSEVITVISDATAVDFAGHINAGQVIIDAIAPGYVDTRGSLVGDIIIIRPVTEWANNIFNVLNQSLNNDGTIKTSAITYQPMVFDHIVPNGAVLTGLNYGTTLTASLSAGVCYINGLMNTIAAVATRTYTASKDTYVDALYSATGVATIVYTEVANNAASPALAANSIRIGIVVSGANIANAAAINQGQEDRILPIASSIPYSVVDSLGNMICPRDPTRKTISIKQILVAFSGGNSSNGVVITGLSTPVNNFPVGRKLKATLNAYALIAPASQFGEVFFWTGATLNAQTTQLSATQFGSPTGGAPPVTPSVVFTPTSSSFFITASLYSSAGGNDTIYAATNKPTQMLLELA